MRKVRSDGFTLIELLVVISIIGVLATLVIANFNAARVRARDAQRKSNFDQVKKALRMYYNDHNGYPTTAELPSWGVQFAEGDMVYMKILPKDPKEGSSYNYYAGASCSEGAHDFRLVAILENKSDQDILKSHTRCGDDCGFTWNATAKNQYVVCAD